VSRCDRAPRLGIDACDVLGDLARDRTGIVLRLWEGTHGRAGGASCTGDLEASARHSGSSETGESFAAGELARGIGTRAGAVARHRQ